MKPTYRCALSRIFLPLVAITFLISAPAFPQGPLTPPAFPAPDPALNNLGQPIPNMKTLTQVEPRTAINATNTPGDADALFKITQPGSYYLTANVTGGPGRSGIEIASPGVSIDLNGFALTGVAGSLHGITTSATVDSIWIRNGALRNWAGSGLSVVTIAGRFGHLTAKGNGGAGLSVGRGSVVTNCSAEENGGHGIQAGTKSVISGCSADGNTGDGIRAAGQNVVRSCAAGNNSGNGLWVDSSSVIVDCSATSNTLDGIKTFSGSRVSGCVAVANSNDGIEAASNGRLTENTCSSNGSGATDAGIHVTGDGNRIEGNNLAKNTSRGIKVDATNNLIIRNSAFGNTTQNFDIPAGNTAGTIVASEAAMNAAANGNVNISF